MSDTPIPKFVRFSGSFLPLSCAFFLSITAAGYSAEPGIRQVGVASIDITPDYPVRLSGYGNRRSEHEGVEQRIHAKALAIGAGDKELAILLTVDNCGVPFTIRLQVLQRLQKDLPLKNERFAIASSHTHSAPMVEGVLPNLFSSDIPEGQQANIKRYTKDLADNLVKVALAAVKNRKTSRLDWGIGSVGFAMNRRTKGGPVDHDLPVLSVRDLDGTLRAVFVNYACHCTALSGAPFNRICGDWAGYAQEEFEKARPGATMLVAIGCGADQNPNPKHAPNHGLGHAKQHGKEIVKGTLGALSSKRTMLLKGELNCKTATTKLEFERRTRDEWETRAANSRANISYHAKKNLARLDRGETLQAELPYMVQTWSFGDEMAMVFLPGEVVVDYSLRLKREYISSRIWVNAYANDVPCYIPSERILREGGYEGESAMVYYDRPNKFKKGVEQKIMAAIRQTIPESFKNPKHRSEIPPPVGAKQSLSLLQTKPGFHVELVASEPMVVDPIAIDFGIDGKLWVVEMNDYPSGIDGDWKPGGRVKYLKDLDGDGHFDHHMVFLKDLPFPTGVMAWRDGALVCAAPDILYAEDTDDDGWADKIEKLYSGFLTDNYQARVNSLTWGLDNWVHGANGLRGGKIIAKSTGRELDIRSKDFRIKPDLGLMELASGYTQQGRVRNDWGDWFGCNNSSSLFQYPIPEQYKNRNPHVAMPADRHYVPAGDNPERIYPASELLERFNRPEHANRVTGGCGLGIYRDMLMGQEYEGDAFVCAPVHNLVRRLELLSDGPTFRGIRAQDERRSEFLASADNWFRPVQATTGPDGALWVVDMYRFVIEHPRWIPEERLAKLDVRAGSDRGRIYRVYPRGKRLKNHSDLSGLSSAELAAKLNSGNGTLRDMIHQELVRRRDKGSSKELEKVARSSRHEAARVQALCALDGIGALRDASLHAALRDESSGVRRHAIRLSEKRLQSNPSLATAVLKLTKDPEATVRFQLALSLGNWRDKRAGGALGKILARDMRNSWMRAAVLSSAETQPAEIFEGALHAPADDASRGAALGQLTATAAAVADKKEFGRILTVLATTDKANDLWRWQALYTMQEALDRRRIRITDYSKSTTPSIQKAADKLKQLYAKAHGIAADTAQPMVLREAAIRLHGRGFNSYDTDLPRLARLFNEHGSPSIQNAALANITRRSSEKIPPILFEHWPRHSPALRSAVIARLMARQPWIVALLDVVESGKVAPADIDPVTRLRLSRNSDEGIKARVDKLLPLHNSPDRKAVIARYKDVAGMKGDATHGAEVFKTACATCHKLNGQGFDVGPDLSVYRNKGVADFLEAILDPNAIIEPRFVNYNVDTRDGLSLSGIIASESSSSVTLFQAQGLRQTLARADIRAIQASSISLMPDGLEQAIPPKAMADLIAFLKLTPPGGN